jgi:hypothetical protein
MILLIPKFTTISEPSFLDGVENSKKKKKEKKVARCDGRFAQVCF